MSLLQDSSGLGIKNKEPAWLENSNRRVIVNHLVPKKKLTFELAASKNAKDPATSNSANSFVSTDFNGITFGNKLHRNSSAGLVDASVIVFQGANDSTAENDDLPLYNNSEDLPPPRSLMDLNDEFLLSLGKPTQQADSFLNKDPRTLSNVFNRDAKNPANEDPKTTANPLAHSETAVLVFGYPESMANQVISHFADFGTILEDFEAVRSSKANPYSQFGDLAPAGAFKSVPTTETKRASPPPMFCGKSWVKLTYDNPASAIDALQESGSVFNGALIGVVPYTKDTLEKLRNRKITSAEDIGGGLQGLVHVETNKVDQRVIGDSSDLLASYINRIDVKDGSEFFLKLATGGDLGKSVGKLDSKKLGLWGTVSSYFFGFHDL